MPKRLEDSPAHATNSFPGDKVVSYDEGILVGYRWFDTKNIEPIYPFGYGLSYTTFAIKNARADKNVPYITNDTIYISVDVENTGDMDGKEVVQLYTTKKDSKVERAAQELKGFEKVHVKKGETSTVTLALPVKELAYYDIEKRKWVIEPGNYDLRLGNSSRAINTVVSVAIGTE